MRTRLGIVTALSVTGLLSACTGDTTSASRPSFEASSGVSPSASESPDASTPRRPSAGATSDASANASPDKTSPTPSRTPRPRPVSVEALDATEHRGDLLTLGAVRERTADYTSYDVTYRSASVTPRGRESYRISGVVNVPTGRGRSPPSSSRTATSTRRSTCAGRA